jgi:hypothetical protein
MSLSFPLNPTLNQTYSYGTKTWVWNGAAWQLQSTGAINDIPIGNITPNTGAFTDLSATGNIVTDQYFIGDGSQITGITTLENDDSNVTIGAPGGNVTVSVDGTSNVAVFSSGGLTLPGNVTANTFFGNVVGNISGNVNVTGANTEVLYNNNGVIGASPNFTFKQDTVALSVAGSISANTITATGTISTTGNVVGNYIQGDGSKLTKVLADRGSDSNNWNTMTEMGVYTVNRASWAGTVGTPLDSQVFVGQLEVKNSTDTSINQVFYPGTVEEGNVKIQWNRTNWGGTWSAWIKIVNDYQVVTGGEF